MINWLNSGMLIMDSQKLKNILPWMAIFDELFIVNNN